jgi:hypothetical protein
MVVPDLHIEIVNSPGKRILASEKTLEAITPGFCLGFCFAVFISVQTSVPLGDCKDVLPGHSFHCRLLLAAQSLIILITILIDTGCSFMTENSANTEAILYKRRK